MAAARNASTAARFAFTADEPAPPEMVDVVRRQRQLMRRAAALSLDPIAEEDDADDNIPFVHANGVSSSPALAPGSPWASTSDLMKL